MLVSLPTQNKLSKQHVSANALRLVPTDLLNREAQDSFDKKIGDVTGSTDSNNHQRFSHLLSIMPAGVLVVDHTGTVSLANEQAKNLLGEPIIGEAWRDVIARVFTPKDDDGHEVSMRNGKRVKIDISPLTQEKGQLIVITDLTETRQLQSRVGQMQRLSSLGKMVASLAHQVRTPLSSALLYAENLKAMPLQNETASRFSEKLTLRLKELEAQVNDMLLFAKSSDKQIVSVLSSQDIVQQAVSQTDAQLEQAGITLNVKNTGIESRVLGNLTAITGAISNLIVNAMQALSNNDLRSPLIQVELSVESVSNTQYTVYKVIDNGNGISDDKLPRLFEPFYTTKSQGTGLGLAVVNTVAKSHQGFVKCGNNAQHTENASGAFFALYIPLDQSHLTSPIHSQHSGVDNE